MKKLILSISITIMIGLIITIYINENQERTTFPELMQLNEVNENQNESEELQSDPLQPVNNNMISYTLQNKELNVTFNGGNDWLKVPIEKDSLFSGEYTGNEQELIDGSYSLNENRSVFLYQQGGIYVTYTMDQGKTWKEGVVSNEFPIVRFRKVDFINDQFGYVVLSGDRTMSHELSTVFLTYDGGQNWEETTNPPTMRLIADGGFVDEMIGFMSYGTINPEKPEVYVTQDGGDTWRESIFNIPATYDRIFVQAELPVKEDGQLSVLVNQGPNGDYLGGKVKGKFISENNGNTWDFLMEVSPSETE